MIHKRSFAKLDWITGEGHEAQTNDITNVSGKIVAYDVKVNSVTAAGLTVSGTIKDVTNASDYTNVPTIASFSTAAEDTVTKKLARSNKATQDADFNEYPCSASTLRVSVDPSADPGGSGQTLEVDVDLYIED